MKIKALVKTFFPIMICSMVVSSCTTNHYRKSADTEVYRTIQGKSSLVPGMSSVVSVDTGDSFNLEQYPLNTEVFDFLDTEAESEINARILSLTDALDLAFHYNKNFQLQKERLYLEALSLTLDRYDYTPIFSARADGSYYWDQENEFVQDAQTLLNVPTGDIVTTESVDAGGTLSGSLLLRGGGRLALGLTTNFLRFLTGDISETANTALIGSFTQPILRGAGSEVAAEALMQAERNLLYQLRDFTRFRKSLAVQVASQYYSVLRNRDAARNNFLGLGAVEQSLERERAFQVEGLRTLGQVGRLEESALQRDLSLTRSITRYKNSLDNLKIVLGLNVDDLIMLSDAEMELVSARGLKNPDLDLQQALDLALDTRLDLYTEMDQIQDSARRINLAGDAFKPQLDLILSASVPDKGSNRIGEIDFRRTDFRAGLDLILPVSNKAQRNSYRRALINYEASVRSYESAVDTIKLQILDAWRSREQAEKNYVINLASVNINLRRVDEAELRAELGLGNVQDTVDAQNDLTNAKTALTSAIVDHNIANLELWRDIGLIYVSEDGQWEEGIDEL